MNTYELAPATALVATRCCACGRPLLDARSVETGMGPTCREKHGFDVADGAPSWGTVNAVLAGLVDADALAAWAARPDGARAAANTLVHRIAADQTAACVPSLIAAVSALGFGRVAAAIAAHLIGAVRVIVAPGAGGTLEVTTEGRFGDGAFDAWTAMLRGVRGRRWDSARRVNLVPASSARELWEGMKAALPRGSVVVSSTRSVVV